MTLLTLPCAGQIISHRRIVPHLPLGPTGDCTVTYSGGITGGGDTFDCYTDGDNMSGQNGGSGWGGAWTVVDVTVF
jgi:hypothetical protein